MKKGFLLKRPLLNVSLIEKCKKMEENKQTNVSQIKASISFPFMQKSESGTINYVEMFGLLYFPSFVFAEETE